MISASFVLNFRKVFSFNSRESINKLEVLLFKIAGDADADGGDLAAANCDILHAIQSAGWVDHTAARDHEVKLFRHMLFFPG